MLNKVKRNLAKPTIILSLIMSFLNQSSPTYSSEVVEGLKKCDATLAACDNNLKEKDKVIEKQDQVIKAQSEELALAKSDNPLKKPVLWIGVAGAAIVIAGPIAIPFAVIGAVIVEVLVK